MLISDKIVDFRIKVKKYDAFVGTVDTAYLLLHTLRICASDVEARAVSLINVNATNDNVINLTWVWSC